jgi:serine/threonine-protein kinase
MWRWLSKGKQAAQPSDATRPGGLANYRIERLMGKGAASQVFLAQDRRSGRWVALKVLELGSGVASPESHDALERFRREATVLHDLDHPGIVAVLDAGPSERGAWMAMEAVAGCDLTRYTRPSRLLPPPLVARIGARVAEALAYAHRRGVVHRDVKPANVLVDWTKDAVKLSDFGLARSSEHTQTRSGITLGSPDYMAPEQLAGGAVGPAADVYGLGATLFELLAGRRPHQADNLGELLRAVASEPAPQLARLRPELDPALCDAVMLLLAKDQAQRPSDAARVAAHLWSVANGTVGEPPTP